jgi:translocation and assembly module TamB
MTRARHLLWQSLVAAAILLVLCAGAGILVVRSGWFREKVRQRMIAEVEAATGGRVEMGNFSFKWETLVARISPLVLHGTEPASETPLLRIETVSVGLRIISLLERKVDLASLRVEQPRLRIVIYPDGSDNLPVPPGRPSGKDWAQNLVDLAVRRYAVTGGLAEVDIRQVPLDFSGEDLRLQMTRDTLAARYRGEVASRHLRVAANFMMPAEADMSAAFTLDGTRLNFAPLRLAAGGSRIDLNGSLTNLRRPLGAFKAKAQIALRDAVPMFSLPLKPTGAASFDGDLAVSFAQGFDFTLSGRASARGLGYAYDRLNIENATASAALNASPERVTLSGIQATALGAKITGQADLIHNREFHFQGNLDGLEVRQAARVLTDRPMPWNGVLAGTLETDAVLGEAQAKVHAQASIVPAAEGMPVEGQIEIGYDQQTATIRFGDSHVNTPATSVTLSGTLGQASLDQNLDVRARTTNLDDVLTALSMAGDAAPRTLPLQFNRSGGEASLAGVLTGRLTDPEFRGEIAVGNASVAGRGFDRLNGDIQASRRSVALRRMTISRGQTQIAGDVALAASGGASGGDFATGPLTAQLSVKNASLAEAARELGVVTDARGTASATLRLSGTARQPEADVAFDATKVTALGEQAERVRGNLRYTARSLVVNGGQADLVAGKLLFAGSFEHPADDFKNGDVRADVTAQGVVFSRIAALHKLQPGIEARLDGKAAVEAQVQRGALRVRSVNGVASARSVTLDKETLGDVNVSAGTSGNELALQAKAQLRGTALDAQGKWRMEGDLPGSATFRFPRLSVAALHDLVMLRGTAAQKAALPPLDGFVEGSGTATLSLLAPDDFQAEVKIDKLQLNPKSTQTLRLGVPPQDVQIQNSQPILITVNSREARIRAAHLIARDTDLEASGAVPFSRTGGADFAVKGTVNLAVLQLFNSDLLARGTANVSASVRGSLRDPRMNGRMEFTNASLYMNDVPNGIDSTSGTILFDRNRATIERLTAEVGGGQIALRGFLEFGDTLIYRLQAEARQVRVRYPEDVSFTGNAQLALTGTSDASTLSGTVTLNRAAISPGVDLGKLLAQAAKPSPAPPNPNEYLRGMRFDVHIGSSPTFELETSLTRNVATEVDLHLRGAPLRPALLGSIAVNSGEIQVFGNRYTVNRGDIRFLNPVRIEPTLDMDLETRTRGITVNVTISGSAERLNVNYSSDPPLQSREIIALLAVGRDPTALSNAAQFSSSTAGFSDAGGLLGEAVSQQLSNRLQRFFGASRVKIDPTLTGIDNLPSARLTVEQQVSRDITLTYITNLNRTQEQIVRVQWDLNRRWSAVAVRNSNGLFGIDIQYRKRFK